MTTWPTGRRFGQCEVNERRPDLPAALVLFTGPAGSPAPFPILVAEPFRLQPATRQVVTSVARKPCRRTVATGTPAALPSPVRGELPPASRDDDRSLPPRQRSQMKEPSPSRPPGYGRRSAPAPDPHLTSPVLSPYIPRRPPPSPGGGRVTFWRLVRRRRIAMPAHTTSGPSPQALMNSIHPHNQPL